MIPWPTFSKQVYSDLEKNEGWFPEQFARMFTYMKAQDWLFNYRTRGGIEKSFGGLVRRAAYLHESQVAFQIFEDHYQRFDECYRHFWASLKYFARQEFDRLLKDSVAGSE